MKTIYKYFAIILTPIVLSCGNNEGGHSQNDENLSGFEEGNFASFTSRQYETLAIEVGPLSKRNLSNPIQLSGILEVPPQHEAIVTTVVGANITQIQVIEGDPVKKGQVLAYLSHPNLIKLQSDYLESINRFEMAELEFNRQQRLLDEEVGAGKTFQQAQSEFRSARSLMKGYESQLSLLGINGERLKAGEFYDRVPILSPITGSIVDVWVKNGQFVQPETELFELINTDHIHVKLLVYEKDINHVKIGQEVRFRLNHGDGVEFQGSIFSVSQKFDAKTKAIQVHAEIDSETNNLVPGMYVKADILTDTQVGLAIPEKAIFNEAGRSYAFQLADSQGDYVFIPRELVIGKRQNGWVEVSFLEEISEDAHFALNNAYYIHAEMKKGEVVNDH
ncbi:efflux RND transporter periplasmic adaptor subunit [Litoribacter populi]|uniref:efflux RND transporter periplasmic adaptor subunit n=1 Tax=Litoribacter populi TaxID=2598460 RepID=UPI00117C15E9|nr:efflux RND transporter periplasmic adaptor subunit [Litoribacter populi]